MFFKAIVFSFLLLFGAGFVNQGAASNQSSATTTLMEDTYIQYVWIEGVRWAFVYTMDGVLIDSYPDPDY